jgi:hypothetical protein
MKSRPTEGKHITHQAHRSVLALFMHLLPPRTITNPSLPQQAWRVAHSSVLIINPTTNQPTTMPRRDSYDEKLLGFLTTPNTHDPRAVVRTILFDVRRYDLMQRALNRGLIAPTFNLGDVRDRPRPLLHVFAEVNDVGLLRCLVGRHGVDVNTRETPGGSTALHIACFF